MDDFEPIKESTFYSASNRFFRQQPHRDGHSTIRQDVGELRDFVSGTASCVADALELLYGTIRHLQIDLGNLQTEVKNLRAKVESQGNRLSSLQTTVNSQPSEDDLLAAQMVAYWHPDCCSVADYLEYDYDEERRAVD